MAQVGELYALDPALPVLLRPDGAVQVGWSPRRALLIRPPRGVSTTGLAAVLRAMHSPVPIDELQRQSSGLSDRELGDLVARLVTAGVATRGTPSGRRALRRYGYTAAARCPSCWPRDCGARELGSRRATSHMPR